MPIWRRAEPHMIHGSTVTYSVVPDSGYSVISGVSTGSARMSSIASSSACLVAWWAGIACFFLVSWNASGEKVARTFRSSFVRLRALAMIFPSRTKTQPTGTSPAASASSACYCVCDLTPLQILVVIDGHTMFIASLIHAMCTESPIDPASF
jgi:hypothetical protein